jgi:protocatechuate 3,4-dioxygenase beta subunit
VTLSGGAGTTTTDANGGYAFRGLAPGSYTISETQPAGYLDGKDSAGSAGGTADNSQAGRDAIAGVTLTPGTNATGYLFGEVTAASLSGSVFVDTDDDGVRDAGEAGILGVTVTLTGTDLFGNAVTASTQQTGADGGYAFTGIAPGTYAVAETQPAGYFDGRDAAGTSGGIVAADTVTAIPVAPGADAAGYTFGERAPVSISGAVFSDLDGDGAVGAGEPGVPGATVELLDAGGGVLDTITTTASGTFSFTGLAPGVYSLRKTLPAGAHFSDGMVTAGTAGGTPAAGEIDGIDLRSGSASGYLFAEIALAAIRGTVWHDANDNGVMDAGEQPIAGVTVTLGGDADRTTTTSAAGAFTFADLAPGTYSISETQPGNWADGRTVAGDAGGTVGTNTVSGIVLGADTDASGYGFAERVAQLQVFVAVQGVAADAAPGPNVRAGAPVALTYRVVNNGDTSLDAVTVTDGSLTVDCPPGPLAPHTAMECHATAAAAPGAQSRDVSATATVVPVSGQPAPQATQVTATTIGHYFGMVATATIAATVDGKAAGEAPGPVFPDGTEETVVVTITNTGNIPLTLVSLDAGALGALDCGAAAPIPPGGHLVCTTTHVFAPGNWSAEVTAHLSGPDALLADGSTSPTEVTPSTPIWFQVLEPDVVVPALASTGSDGSRLLLASSVLLLVGTGIVSIVWWERRTGRKGLGGAA